MTDPEPVDGPRGARQPSGLSAADVDRYFASGIESMRRISEHPPVYLTFDPLADEVRVRAPFDGRSPDLEGYERLSVEVIQEVGAQVEWFSLTIDAIDARYESYLLVASIAEFLRGGLAFRVAVHEAIAAFRDLLSGRRRLSAEEQVGLVGELLVLEHCVDRLGESSALESWIGTRDEEHDFAFSSFDLEVKTTRSEARTHVVGTITQLEPLPGRELFLLSIQLTRAGSADEGLTLGDLISRVRGRLSADHGLVYVSRLKEVGWRERDDALYPERWVFRTTPQAYLVDDEFPAITPARVASVVPRPELVVGVSYRLDVTSLSPSAVPSPILEFCEVHQQ